MPLENRIIELETRLSYQDHLMQELNEVVTRQQQQIDRMEKQLHRLHDQSRAADPGLARPDEEIPPPHY